MFFSHCRLKCLLPIILSHFSSEKQTHYITSPQLPNIHLNITLLTLASHLFLLPLPCNLSPSRVSSTLKSLKFILFLSTTKTSLQVLTFCSINYNRVGKSVVSSFLPNAFLPISKKFGRITDIHSYL